MKNLQFFVVNHLWISFSFFVISNSLQPWLFGHRPKNGNSLMKFLGDLMSALFPDDHHQRFPQLRTDWSKRGRIRERIVLDSQHQIVFQLNFYFYTVRPGIDLQKSERIFLLTLKTCPWKSDILSPKLGKNPTILVKKLPIGQNSLQVEDRKLEMTYLHLHFAFVQRQVSNRGKWIFCQRFQEFSLFSPRFEQIYSLLIMENIMFKSFVWLLAHFILCRSYLDPLCMYQPHTYSTLTTY